MATTGKPRNVGRGTSKQSMAMALPTAAGRVSTAAMTQLGEVNTKNFEVEEWQPEAYNHTTAIGELGYVVNLQADTVARGVLKIAERNLSTGKVVEPEKDEEGVEIIDGDREKAENVLLALRGPRGGQEAIMHSGAVADVVAGEGHLIGEPIEDTNQLSWEFVSVIEVNAEKDGSITRKRSAKRGSSLDAGKSDGTAMHEDTYVSRYHRADWVHSGDPTSPLRRVASACREVILLTQLVEATIKSHLPAGILKVPNEVTFPGASDDEYSGDADDGGDADPFLERLIEHMSAPITDRRSAAALVPLVVSGPAEALAAFDLLQLKDTKMDLGWVMELRNDALGRVATGLDVPPEVMSGKGGLNHWTGANVDQDFIEKHVVPIGDRLARFLTVSYLRRMLVVFEGMSEDEAERFEIEYDASALLTRADAAGSADRLHRDGLISDDARIEANGMDPDKVRVSQEERERRFIERMILAASVSNKPLFPAIGLTLERLVELGITVENAEALLAPRGATGPDEEPDEARSEEQAEESQGTEDTSADTVPGDPTGGEAPDESLTVIMERVRSLADASLENAIRHAANLACGKLPKDSQVTKDQIRSLPKLEILSKIPAADWTAMRLTPEKLMRDAWNDFTHRSVFWLTAYYEGHGVDRLAADEKARRIISEIALALNTQALAAFKRAPVRSNGMLVSMDVVLDAAAA